jgi:hypothetical protein
MASGAVKTEKSTPLGRNGAPAPASGAERRASVRYPCHLDILYWQSTGAAEAYRSAKILDVSATGIGLLMSRPFETGTVLTIQLESANQKYTRTLMVHVVHARQQSHNEWVVGCAFDSKVTEEEARALGEWSLPSANRPKPAEEVTVRAAPCHAKLSPKQKRAVDALLTMPTLASAARAVKVRESTLRAWLGLPQFQAACRAARRQTTEIATGRLQHLAANALDVLEQHLNCGKATLEIQAALCILTHAVQSGQRTKRRPRTADLMQHLQGSNCQVEAATAG